MTHNPDQLNAEFKTDKVVFHSGQSNLPCARVITKYCTGEVYLHGAHVTAFQPIGQKPVLWMSQSSFFQDKKPIRGGVPICFPWFGPHATDNTLPAHGWARTKSWDLESVGTTTDGGAKIEFKTEIAPFKLRFSVTFAAALNMELQVALPFKSQQSATFESALHTYLAVGDVHKIEIEGLAHAKFLDKVGPLAERPATQSSIRFEGETDRVYRNTRTTCTLLDPVFERRIQVSKWGSDSTVIWNPWIEKSKRMADFGDDEWPDMVCIETANIRPSHIELGLGQIHTMQTKIELV